MPYVAICNVISGYSAIECATLRNSTHNGILKGFYFCVIAVYLHHHELHQITSCSPAYTFYVAVFIELIVSSGIATTRIDYRGTRTFKCMSLST